MKKFLALVMAMMMVLAMGTVAFADASTTNDDATVVLKKTYNLTNAGTTSPAETFTFSALTCTSVTNAAAGVTTDTAPIPTIGSVSYTEGEAGSATATKEITINIPNTYTSVGIYTYSFTEVDNNVAGVTYRPATNPIYLVVTVIQDTNGRLRVAAVHTEGSSNTGNYGVQPKSDVFTNEYSASSLEVSKTVTGNMGDQSKYFTMTVTFTAPSTGEKVMSDIYWNGGSGDNVVTGIAVDAGDEGWTGDKTVTINLKHTDKITFTNIPYGVTYEVTENSYSADGYDDPTYTYSDNNKEIGTAAADTVVVTNNKGVSVDTGINMDNAPYMMIMAMVVLAGVAMMMKKRAYND